MNETWTWIEISKVPSKNSVIFKLCGQEMSNYFVMFSLSFSVCGYRTFRRVQDVNMIRWSILSHKILNSLYTSSASWTCNPVAPPIITEGLKYKRSLWKLLKPLTACCYICGFVYVFLFFWSRVGQILNYCGHYCILVCTISYLWIMIVSKNE
jgi:hypothetical protein